MSWFRFPQKQVLSKHSGETIGSQMKVKWWQGKHVSKWDRKEANKVHEAPGWLEFSPRGNAGEQCRPITSIITCRLLLGAINPQYFRLAVGSFGSHRRLWARRRWCWLFAVGRNALEWSSLSAYGWNLELWHSHWYFSRFPWNLGEIIYLIKGLDNL